jgi:hydroxyacylglutathione hydrolase
LLDVLFRGTVGGTRGPGGSDLSELRRSVDRVLALPLLATLHPGHGESTTVAEELATNPFVLAWGDRGSVTREDCTVRGEPAELLLWGPDYDGTHKAWVRLADGTEHITGGSQVVRAPSAA